MSGPGRSLVIVAGGRSRRLGRNKPLVEIGGRTVLSRILEATADIADVVLAVREVPPFRRALAAQGWESGAERAGGPAGSVALRHPKGRALRVVPDPVPDLGPLAGVASGLEAADGAICVVLAGDLPFVTPHLVDRLCRELASAAESDALDAPDAPDALDAIVPRARGRAQPLCAAYRREVGRLAARLVARGGARGDSSLSSSPASSPSMMSFLERLRVRYVTAEDLAGAGDLETMVRGVDSRADLDWAVRRASRPDGC